jgi:hypothetical protein
MKFSMIRQNKKHFNPGDCLIDVTTHPRHVPYEITIRSTPHSWLITSFETRVTRRVTHVEQEQQVCVC